MDKAHYESYQEKDKMLLKVLDEDGNITDLGKTKKEVHDEHLWHQEVAIFIINSEGKILLQKRSKNVYSSSNNNILDISDITDSLIIEKPGIGTIFKEQYERMTSSINTKAKTH